MVRATGDEPPTECAVCLKAANRYIEAYEQVAPQERACLLCWTRRTPDCGVGIMSFQSPEFKLLESSCHQVEDDVVFGKVLPL